MVASKQITLIHIAKNQLNWDDDHYRSVLEARYNVTSSAKLDYTQATDFIDFLVTLGFKPQIKRAAPKKRRATGDNIVHLATPFQHKMIDDLQNKIKWHAGADGFRLWLKKRLGITAIKTSREAQATIEGLKGMLRRS